MERTTARTVEPTRRAPRQAHARTERQHRKHARPANPSRIKAIDGLKGLAIAAVVLYHLRPTPLPGGFLGVTLFFVISGFLITQSIERELARTRRFSYGRYLVKRIARLLPPVLVVIVFTAIATYIASPSLLPKVQSDAFPAALFFLNWSYIFRDVPYFAAAGLPSPLTHLWYLGVLMQFYVFWPAIVIGVHRVCRSRKQAMGVCAALALASMLAMALLYDPSGDTARVYYGTDTRLAELAMGALTALALSQLKGLMRAIDRAGGPRPMALGTLPLFGAMCLALLLVGFLFASGESFLMYRGGYAAAAVISAILLITVQIPGDILGRILAHPPFTYLGSRSLSIYLVHYPMLILMNPATRTTALAWWEQALQVVAVLVVAEAFYRIVEAPCAQLGSARRGHAVRKRGTAPVRIPLVLAAAGAVAVTTLNLPLDWNGIAQSRAVALRPELTAQADGDKQAPAADTEKQTGPIAEKVPENLPWKDWTYDEKTGTCDADVLIIGDSVTEMAIPSIMELLPNAYVDGKVSRQLYVGQDVYAEDVAAGHDASTVIYALGGNGLIRNESQVQTLIDSVEGKPLYFMTIRCPLPLQDANNEILRRYAAENPNVGIIDWHGATEGHDEYLVDDGQHLTQAGCEAFAQLIFQALCVK